MDYIFITVEDFMELEKSGALLESGTYEGKHSSTAMPAPCYITFFPLKLIKTSGYQCATVFGLKALIK